MSGGSCHQDASDRHAGGLRGSREEERERRAFALARLDGDLAAVGLRDVADDREPESGAAGLAAARPIDAVEALEDPFEIARRDPDAVVAHDDRDAVVDPRAPTSTGCPASEYLIALSSRLMRRCAPGAGRTSTPRSGRHVRRLRSRCPAVSAADCTRSTASPINAATGIGSRAGASCASTC